jgi:Fe-S-cluster containining protein
MPTDRPRTRADVDELKWHIQYEGVSAFVANRRWYIQVRSRCKYLTRENLCSIYERRPQRCRRHNPPDCERHGDYFTVRLDTPEELEAHVAAGREARNARRRALRRARNRPSTSPAGR